ncbi:MAG: mechanosensitive ion channel [Cyanothece sp. SIO1E1]|nr:mechanosensitive ion channel [Cyanothece sp. SIO1E1]
MNETLHVIEAELSPGGLSSPLVMALTEGVSTFTNGIGNQLGGFIPSFVGALMILIVGWLVATIAAAIVRGLLSKTDIDNRIVSLIMGQEEGMAPPPVEKWVAAIVYWIIMTFVLVAFLNALKLEAVSQPLNNFLQQIFSYLPKVGAAALWLGFAWLLATAAKLFVTRGLSRFKLDDKLAGSGGDSPFLVNETLGDALYWFIFLFFLPLILGVLDLQGPLEPVQNLLNQFLAALPKIVTALIIGVVGWFIAKVVRGIVTNLLAATGADSLGARFGLSEAEGGLSLSGLVGTLVYVLVLIPTTIAALNALEIAAISEPAVAMLEQVLTAIPQIFTAALILVLFYVIGKFVAELVTNLLKSFGFDNLFSWLGLPDFSSPSSTTESAPEPEAEMPADSIMEGEAPIPYVRPEEMALMETERSPSEVVGIIVMVAIILFGAIAATEVLQFEALTGVVRAILSVSARVLSGVLVFGVGLYLANLAFGIINSSGTPQAKTLGQTARIAIIALVGAMALQQMGVATNIVNLAFGLLLGAIAVAIAIAFGLGGRDVAAEQVRDWLNSFKSGS